MRKWDEIRTAYEVARLGTISAAAAALGLHRATVVRHVEALEAELGAKLFQRNPRGYVPTDVGEDLFQVAHTTEAQFADFVSRTRGRSNALTGELIVTSVEVIAPLVIGAVRRFQDAHPQTTIRYRVSGKFLKLEYGEAHVAVRSGPQPEDPDNVVQAFVTLRSAMYAHRSYIERFGRPQWPEGFTTHQFVGPSPEDHFLPFSRWLAERVPSERMVFISANPRIQRQAVEAQIGIGFLPEHIGRYEQALVEVHPTVEAWDVRFWLLTHVDLHRTPKVQAFLRTVKEEAAAVFSAPAT